MDNDEYLIQEEPCADERRQYWKTAIGLQDVDALKPSDILLEAAEANISGKATLYETEKFITDYYEHNPKSAENGCRDEEADKVSVRIVNMLYGKTFNLSPVELISIHRRLFTGIYDFAGKIRDYNITKKEWVLNGETVFYGDCHNIREMLDYDFSREKDFDYGKLEPRAAVEHIVKFIADLWQIHAFGEGNTRTTAVFAIKYLRTFGYNIDNDTFEKKSRYFRNALVRANYNNHRKGVKATQEYLNRFFGNLLFGEQNKLSNRKLHIDSKETILETLERNKRNIEDSDNKQLKAKIKSAPDIE